ncbi:hypothetical protein K470DRAFT_272595 [Piedraia hortae CBS 480.64]|uniref:RRM domain-containing protein n=1 Tax=Piedraia hortae CBS 480.64 TaxID=1314780 RepID=A0A6A7BU46_9PEZI|nr:hypothetical protein K470DRAFT_272595 [Piedraia hortae CBS 480.64]
MSTLTDYTTLPLSLPPQPSFPTKAKHYIYIRTHTPNLPTATSNRELFLSNIPLDATPQGLKSIFSGLGGGKIEHITFDEAAPSRGLRKKQLGRRKRRASTAGEEVGTLPRTVERELHPSGRAIVRFVDGVSRDAALREVKRMSKKGMEWRDVPLGVQRYQKMVEMRYPDPVVLQKSVDEFMEEFNREEERERKKRRTSKVDDDGFVTVTRGVKRDEAPREVKKVGKEDFYRFQMREKRKADEKDLIKRYERDVKKMEAMKKLKPQG